MNYCQKCGKKLDANASFCEFCGTRQTLKKTSIKQPNQSKLNASSPPPINKQKNLNQSNNNSKLSQKTWFIILMLIFLFPIGLLLIWINKKFSLTTKTVISCIFGLLFLIGFVSNDPEELETLTIIESTTEATTETTIETTTELIELDYTLVDSSDYIKDGQFYKLHRIIVNDKATEAQLRNIYHKLTNTDKSYLHTIKFYGNKPIDGNSLYSVAILEGLTKNEEPAIKFITEEITQATTEPVTETTTLTTTTVEVTSVAPQAKSNKNTNYNSNMVYIGDTGDKYHKASCATLKDNGYAISLETALSQGREACKRCKP